MNKFKIGEWAIANDSEQGLYDKGVVITDTRENSDWYQVAEINHPSYKYMVHFQHLMKYDEVVK